MDGLTYIINTDIGNVKGWHVDKGGIIIKEKIIIIFRKPIGFIFNILTIMVL